MKRNYIRSVFAEGLFELKATALLFPILIVFFFVPATAQDRRTEADAVFAEAETFRKTGTP
jgi:hypothetical protein